METREFEQLKKKHAILDKKRTENEAEIKSILKRLKDEFESNNIEEAELLVEKLEEKIESDTAQLDSVVKRIKKAVDWESINEN